MRVKMNKLTHKQVMKPVALAEVTQMMGFLSIKEEKSISQNVTVSFHLLSISQNKMYGIYHLSLCF